MLFTSVVYGCMTLLKTWPARNCYNSSQYYYEISEAKQLFRGLPLNFDLMLANSLLIRFTSASLLLPANDNYPSENDNCPAKNDNYSAENDNLKKFTADLATLLLSMLLFFCLWCPWWIQWFTSVIKCQILCKNATRNAKIRKFDCHTHTMTYFLLLLTSFVFCCS